MVTLRSTANRTNGWPFFVVLKLILPYAPQTRIGIRETECRPNRTIVEGTFARASPMDATPDRRRRRHFDVNSMKTVETRS